MTTTELRKARYNYLTSLAVARPGPYRDDLERALRQVEAAMIQAVLEGK